MGKSEHRAGTVFIASGCILLLCAVYITLTNIRESGNAEAVSHTTYEKFIENIEVVRAEEEEKNSSDDGLPAGIKEYIESRKPADREVEDKVSVIDGKEFVAVLSIPVLDTELPVLRELSMEELKNYPCRYKGAMVTDDIIIAAHNYDCHFGRIKSLNTGDELILTDPSGNRIVYEVTETEILDGTDVEDMDAGDWDLTLFTCTLSGKSRVTVRCMRK